ncbi:stage III sporulation protein AA [Alicyclobacillus acidiphilus]|uniref:stage III sporulation protein AA n=1 Tax=Alicyclobacillus acidiphilus TaxID=182455 RepID=UPI00083529AE|nr:stage III sporulation protein AA [Alicyclobacillus acidiphilus]
MAIPPSAADPWTGSWRELMAILPTDVRESLRCIDSRLQQEVEEIRLRVGQPVELRSNRGSFRLERAGSSGASTREPIILSSIQLDHILQQVTQFSMYAVEEDMRRGFITMPGGHRVGVAGRVVVGEGNRVKAIRNVSSLNIRIAREFPGISAPLRRVLAHPKTGRPYSTLILSPPRCGKTTMLRDIVKQWSDNRVVPREFPATVVVVDERSEIAGCIDGIPQFDLGPRVDVLDACPKADGMLMAIRSLSPELIVTDEIGRQEDALAVLEALHSGVFVIATAHAHSVEEWRRRPHMGELFQSGAFSRYVVLSRRRGPGTIEAVYDGDLRPIAH